MISLNRLTSLVIMALIALMPLLDMLYPAKVDDVSRGLPVATKLILVLCLAFYVVLNRRKWWFRERTVQIFTALIAVHIVYYILSSGSYVADALKISKTMVWFFGLLFFVDIGYRKEFPDKAILAFFSVSMVLLFLLVLSQTSNEELYKSNRDYASSNFAYYLLFVMPFMFMERLVKYRTVLFLLITISVAISMKRGAMLAYIFMVAYLLLFADLKGIGGRRLKSIFRVSSLLVVIYVVKYFITSDIEMYAEKFSDVLEADSDIYGIGSGRGYLYFLPIERWLLSDPMHFLFGFGFNSTPDFYPTTGLLSKGFYAHSDFVMLVHDYGLVGLVLILSVYKHLVGMARKETVPTIKVPMQLFAIALIVKSVLSGFIAYEYSIFGFAVLGLLLGRRRRVMSAS